ncbi:hypothetical protein TrST_g13108 [Triparma strigata]|uniref:Uncharacterized protein n=1 Tax=Triparma strigata TaxID=1606541 RepID=A0A9W7F3M0_9STRA|nr:hypothetical protein TrST_g13108 [Triparma strigata]
MIVNPKLSLQKSLLNSIIDPALKSQPDLSLILLKRHTNEYCAGVYLLKNNSFGRAFIKTWLSTLISTYSSTSDVGVNGDNGVLHQVILSLASPSSSNPCTSLFTPEKYTKKYLPCFHSTLLTLPPSPFIKYLPLATSYTSEIFYTCSATSCHPTVYSHSSTFFLHGLKDFDQEHFMEESIQIEWVERIDMRRVNEDYEFFKEWRRKKVIGGWVMNVTVFVVLGVMLWAVFKKIRSKKKWRRRV